MKTSVPLLARFSVPETQFFLLIAKQLLPVLQFLKELQTGSLEARLLLHYYAPVTRVFAVFLLFPEKTSRRPYL